MTWGNIAIVIGPNILRPERDTMETMLHAKEINVCIEFLFQTISERQIQEETLPPDQNWSCATRYG